MSTEAGTYSIITKNALEQQAVTMRCQQHGCAWTYDGALVDARARFLEHQQQEHPDLAERLAKKRRSSPLNKVEERKKAGMCRRGCDRPHAGAVAGPHAHLCQSCIDEQRASAKASRERTTSQLSRDDMLAGIRRFHSENGRPPSSKDFQHTPWLPSAYMAGKTFGGIVAAWDAAGVPRTDLYVFPPVPAAPATAGASPPAAVACNEPPAPTGDRDGGGDTDPWSWLREAWGDAA